MKKDNGEIEFIDADPLVKIKDLTKSEDFESMEENIDEKAISFIADHLRRLKKYRDLSEEYIDDLAVDLYNKNCSLIRTGRASNEQILNLANIINEKADSLKNRLINS